MVCGPILWEAIFTGMLATQPTPPGHVPLAEIPGLLITAYEHHWFPLIRPAIKPLVSEGGMSMGGKVSSACDTTNPLFNTSCERFS